jgi:hypothetical protein
VSDEDPLRAARGILIGILFSIPFWVALFLAMR